MDNDSEYSQGYTAGVLGGVLLSALVTAGNISPKTGAIVLSLVIIFALVDMIRNTIDAVNLFRRKDK